MYIGNLEKEIDDEMLRLHFSKFGTITSPKVMRDKQGVSKGYGFVCFTTPDEASLAVRMMMGKSIIRNNLYYYQPKTKWQSAPNCPTYKAHCKNILVTSTIFWSSQLHDCCVRDTLQTSKDASNLIQSVVEKLLYFVRLGSS